MGKPTDSSVSGSETESRRTFMRKLAYLAPVVTTFLLSETAYAEEEVESLADRRRRRISPHPCRGRWCEDAEEPLPPPVSPYEP